MPIGYLRHILEAADRILSYGQRGGTAFRRDLMIQDAIVRNLQVMGEDPLPRADAATGAADPAAASEPVLVEGLADGLESDYRSPLSVAFGARWQKGATRLYLSGTPACTPGRFLRVLGLAWLVGVPR